MKTIAINGIPLSVKDYDCTYVDDTIPDEYFPKEKDSLWLYVNVTDFCNANCPFCISKECSDHFPDTVDVDAFERALKIVAPMVSGLTFTGGEPTQFPNKLEQLINIADRHLPEETEFDLATNGTNLRALADLKGIRRFSSIHISRHVVGDEENRKLMGSSKVPTEKEIACFIQSLRDPGAVVLNCVLRKDGVHCLEDVAQYLEFAIRTGVDNVSFITMFQANDYCRQQYVLPDDFLGQSLEGFEDWNKTHSSRFTIWNRMRDYDYCHCMTGDYRSESGKTRFYFRCPGAVAAPSYCRQLVYTADNKLQAGFGKNQTILWK